jgi:serine/threonine protein kinase
MYIIGRGGFGKVWKVRLKKANELFALKEMSKVKIIDRRSEISIMSERNLLSSLHHSFIVNMHFAFQDFYNLYLVMDLLTGGDLRYHIARKRTFSETQTKFIIANMLLALEYIHNNNIIHRDIKPENLVLESNGYVRITDFGVAKINEEDNSSETSGTPGYMAPEVILVQNHSFPSDFFALGVIGYEFMLGYRPYLGRGRKEIKQLIISKQAKLKSDDIPEDWSNESMDFINQLLQRKPKKRLGFNGVGEIKNHPWMKNIDWESLSKKLIDAPFVPPTTKENFDKRYCEGQDNVGEETIERYELYLQSDLYGGVFVNYTFVNMDFISKFDKKQKLRVTSSRSSKSKMVLYNNDGNKNTFNKNNNTIKTKKSNKTIITKKNSNNNDLLKENNKEIKGQNNRNSNPISVRKSNNNISQKNSNINIYNQLSKNNKSSNIINNNENNSHNAIININVNNGENRSNYNTIEQSMKKKKEYDKYSVDNLEKYHTPMVNENIMCNNYINVNFNNCPNFDNNQTNKKNEKLLDVSTIKKILSNHIEGNNNKNDNNANAISNNLSNAENNNNQSDNNTIEVARKRERISVNKSLHNKYTLSKSSSMKLMSGYHNNYFKEAKSPTSIKSNNEKEDAINADQINSKKKGKTNININISNSKKIIYKNSYNKKHYKTNATNYLNKYQTIDTNNHGLSRGKSEFNLKIDTNDVTILSKYHQRHKNRIAERTFNKTASCDRIIMNNNYNNYIKSKNSKNILSNINSKKAVQKERIKNTIDFDKKLMFWIHKSFKNNKQKKNQYNNDNTNNINKNKNNKNKISRHESLLNINSSNYYNNNPIKNKNFPCINSINSINMGSSPIKRIFELNAINSNLRQLKSNRSNYNTINSTTTINKVQSVKNIHNKNSKIYKMLNQNPTFTPFSYQRNKNNSKIKKNNLIKKKFDNTKVMNKMKSTKDMFGNGYSKYNLNLNNYKPRNLKIQSTIKAADSKNTNNRPINNLEYIKSI